MNIGENSQLTDRAALLSAAAVLAVNDLNLSILGPLWLTRHGILLEDEIGPLAVLTPAIAIFPSARFELTLMPQRIQMRFRRAGYHHAQADLLRVVGGIVQTLPHTPYTAVGLNFDYIFSPPENELFATWNRRIFSAPHIAELPGAGQEDALFGNYMSCSVLGVRLKLNMAPVRHPEAQPEGAPIGGQLEAQRMRLGFNYHADVRANPVSGTMDSLTRLDQAFDHSRDVVTSLER